MTQLTFFFTYFRYPSTFFFRRFCLFLRFLYGWAGTRVSTLNNPGVGVGLLFSGYKGEGHRANLKLEWEKTV